MINTNSCHTVESHKLVKFLLFICWMQYLALELLYQAISLFLFTANYVRIRPPYWGAMSSNSTNQQPHLTLR